MTKRLVSVLLLAVMLFAIGAPALAEKKAKAPSDKEIATLVAKVDEANAEVKALVAKTQDEAAQLSGKKADKDLDKLISKMLKEVDKINKEPLKYADKIGATVICEYDSYVIGGKTVLVDPLKVININN